MELPKISILTPTYNRRKFATLSVFNVKNFDYDKNKLSWEILDDGDVPLFTKDDLLRVRIILHPIKVNYRYDNSRHLTIGEKRNLLVKNAIHKTVAFLDDDDIYLPTYLKHSVETMRENKSGLVGSNGMLFVFPYKDFQMAQIQCEAKRQIHEATMVFTKKYYRSMNGFHKNSKGEGSSMVDFSENRCSITDITKCMVCVSHKNNTINKDQFADAKIEAQMSELYKKILSDILDLDYEMVEEETYSASLSDSNS